MPSDNASGEVVPRAPQRERGRARVAALLAAAAALFVEKGFDATTMTEIAASAGASIGSLYLFFPTKSALAQSLLTELAGQLSGRLDALAPGLAGRPAAAIGDALFATLSDFLAEHPVYAVLIDHRGDDAWREAIRVHRRGRIAALFEQASPKLAPRRPDRLAVLVPELMKLSVRLSGRPALPMRDCVLEELRAMLRHHLER